MRYETTMTISKSKMISMNTMTMIQALLLVVLMKQAHSFGTVSSPMGGKQSTTSSRTSLNYQDDVFVGGGVDRNSHSKSSSWFKQFRRRRQSNVGSFVEDESTATRLSKQGIKSSVRDDEQTRVDEYLAFLDRRYHRLHDEPIKKKSRNVAFAKTAAGASSSLAVPCVDNDDALCALGLSGLASQKLLQRIRTASSPFHIGISTAFASSAVTAPNAITVAICTMITDMSRTIVYGTIVVRQHLIKHQSKPIQLVVNLLNNTLNNNIDKAKMAKSVWTLGGGTKNLSWTFTVMAALVLLLVEPLIGTTAAAMSSIA